jgi:hypothetical protein
MRALRWGLLSTAAIGEVVVRANQGSAVTDFVAVASRDAAKAAALRCESGVLGSFDVGLDLADAVEQAATLGAPDESVRTGVPVRPRVPAVSASRGMAE